MIRNLFRGILSDIGLKPYEEEKNGLTKNELYKFVYHNSFSKYLLYGLYDEELGVYYNLDDTIGILFECIPLLFLSERSMLALQNLLKTPFPEGSVIQFICYADPNIDPILEQFMKEKDIDRLPEFVRKAYLSLCDYYRSEIRENIPTRNFRLFVAFKVPLGKVSDVKQIKELKTSIKEGLLAANIQPFEMRPEGLVSFLRRLFNDDVSSEVEFNWDRYSYLRQQVIFAETEIERERKVLRIGNKFFKCMTPKSLPNQVFPLVGNYLTGSYDGVSGDAMQVVSPFFIVFTVVLEDQKTNINAKANMFLMQQSLGTFIVSLNRRKEEYITAIEEMERGEKYFPCYITFWLFDTDKNRLENAFYRGRRIWEGLGFTMQEESLILLPLFFYSLPFGYINDKKSLNFLERHFILPTKVISVLLPVQTDYVGTGEPNLLFIGRKGQIIGLDLFSQASSNYNFLIVAPTGKGKSFTANYLLTNMYSRGAKVRVIDIGASYKKLCNMFGGNFIDFNPEADICINLFQLVRDMTYDLPIITQIIAHMCAVYTGQLPAQVSEESAINILRVAVEYVIRSKGRDATLDDVYDYLSTFPKYFDDYDLLCGEEKPKCEEDFKLVSTHLAFNLRKYTSFGEYGRWFIGENNFDFSRDDFVVIELEHLKTMKDLFGVITLLVLYTCMQDLYLSDRRIPRVILLDEAWQFLQDTKSFQELVEEGYRRARKYYGSFGVITQSILDFEMFGRVGQVILANAGFKFFLESSDFARAREKKILPVDDDFLFNLLNSIKYHAPKYSEIFLLSDRFGSGILRLVIDPYSYYVYTSNPREIAEIEAMVKSGLTYDEAIDRMLEKRKSSK